MADPDFRRHLSLTGGPRVKDLRGCLLRYYSDTTLSAAAVFSAKMFGVMNWAFLLLRSTSVTPRATEHFPQTKIGTL